MNTTRIITPHPYYPLEAEIVGYLANDWHFLTLLAVFASGCVVIFSATYAVAMKVRPHMLTSELVTIMWFVLCKRFQMLSSLWNSQLIIREQRDAYTSSLKV